MNIKQMLLSKDENGETFIYVIAKAIACFSCPVALVYMLIQIAERM